GQRARQRFAGPRSTAARPTLISSPQAPGAERGRIPMARNIVARLALMTLVCGLACDVETDGVTDETEQVAEPGEDGEALTEDEFRDWACILEPEMERRRRRRRSDDEEN